MILVLSYVRPTLVIAFWIYAINRLILFVLVLHSVLRFFYYWFIIYLLALNGLDSILLQWCNFSFTLLVGDHVLRVVKNLIALFTLWLLRWIRFLATEIQKVTVAYLHLNLNISELRFGLLLAWVRNYCDINGFIWGTVSTFVLHLLILSLWPFSL